MSVIGLLVILVILGIIAWAVSVKLPVSANIKLLINIVIAVIAILLCLSAFGVWDEVRDMKVPKI